MKPFETLRNKAFWMLDAAKGGTLKKNVKDLQKIIIKEDCPRSQFFKISIYES